LAAWKLKLRGFGVVREVVLRTGLQSPVLRKDAATRSSLKLSKPISIIMGQKRGARNEQFESIMLQVRVLPGSTCL
jgi:hypothetical protein